MEADEPKSDRSDRGEDKNSTATYGLVRTIVLNMLLQRRSVLELPEYYS